MDEAAGLTETLPAERRVSLMDDEKYTIIHLKDEHYSCAEIS
jgi:hypothetical protein